MQFMVAISSSSTFILKCLKHINGTWRHNLVFSQLTTCLLSNSSLDPERTTTELSVSHSASFLSPPPTVVLTHYWYEMIFIKLKAIIFSFQCPDDNAN